MASGPFISICQRLSSLSQVEVLVWLLQCLVHSVSMGKLARDLGVYQSPQVLDGF